MAYEFTITVTRYNNNAPFWYDTTGPSQYTGVLSLMSQFGVNRTIERSGDDMTLKIIFTSPDKQSFYNFVMSTPNPTDDREAYCANNGHTIVYHEKLSDGTISTVTRLDA